MEFSIKLEGQTEEQVLKISKLKGIEPGAFLSEFLQDSTMIEEFLEETIEDLEEE